MSTRRRLKKNTREQLRAASMRQWRRSYTTPGDIAARLVVPEWWIQRAIRDDVVDVMSVWDALGRRATADDIATAAELPRSFVAFVMRRIHGTKQQRIEGQPVEVDRARGQSTSTSARTTSVGPREQRRTGRRAAPRVTSLPSS